MFFKNMGVKGIDWRLWCKWARSRMSSTTLIYGGKKQMQQALKTKSAD
jgi:hypothetical protein